MRYILLVIVGGFGFSSVFAQSAVAPADSSEPRILQEVIVKAYEQNRKLSEVPAAIGLLTSSQMRRFSDNSIVSAVNTIPGVRMEERSPASYRLNFRGSTLRSPFGVRNVKVYLDGIPFTDPGGNTYLNQLAPYNMESIEVIKGPAGSLYGAGTGGVLLIRTQSGTWQPGASLHYSYGSFNTNNLSAAIKWGKAENANTITYSHQTSDGYRDHTSMRRDIATWETVLKSSEKQTLSSFISYGDLYYQTPGGLTLAQFNANPKQARGAGGGFPSAQQAQAAIFQKTFLAGITNIYRISDHWENTSNVYGAYTQLKNPTFLNYEIRNEPHFGGRTVFTYKEDIQPVSIHINAGAEAQKGFFKTEDFGNVNGSPDTVQTNDNINTWTYSLFAQADLLFQKGWGITAGVSYNESFIGITRLSVPLSPPHNKTFSNQLAPRIALYKKFNENLLLYASIAKGYSPPTVAEILPSSQSINTDLKPEQGVNYEAGIKSSWLEKRLYLEVIAFYFKLQDAIVVRQDSSGASYYINAGHTRQEGIESHLSFELLNEPGKVFSNIRPWLSYTLNHFKYEDFIKNAINYAGDKLPGVAGNTVAAGADISFSAGWYADISYYYSDKMPLNDANTVYASSYNLLGAKIGYKSSGKRKWNWNVFAGVDNAFNTSYSLGNDINASGGRYYNAAAGINYYAGLSLNFACRHS